MERLTKLTVLVSAMCAVSLLAYLVGRGYSQIFNTTVVAFVAAVALSMVAGNLALSVILFLACLVPALFLVLTGGPNSWDFVPWLAALLGFLIPQSVRTGWAFPSRWKAPLILWTLSLALSWPIVGAREVDFVPGLLNHYDLWSSRAGSAPPVTVAWTVSVVGIYVISLLWLNWLFATYSSDRLRRFESRIMWPLLAGALVSAAAAMYQYFGHAGFLNPTVYGTLGRAAGTMLDGNAFGTIAAMWLPVTAARACRPNASQPWIQTVWLMLLIIFGIAIWATGSRTALLAASVGIIVFIVSCRRSLFVNRTKMLIAAGTLAVAIIVGIFVGSTPVMLQRFQLLVPDLSVRTLGAALHELWDRNRYGAAAVRMIAEHSLVGVGVGGFHVQVPDAAYLNGYVGQPSDNAQNWFRHQLAELGILGSAGWLAFSATFVWLLLRRRGTDEEPLTAGGAKGAICGVGVASLLGMPTQSPTVLVTFLALTFWWVTLTGTPAEEATSRLGTRQWAVIGAIVGCFLAGTAYAAWTELRPPYRALRADWKYQYGFHDDAENKELRWTEGKAVDVFPIDQPNEYRWLKLVIGAVAPDASQRPVDVRVWRDHEIIVRVTRRSDVPRTWYVAVPKARKMMMMQVEVSRTWRPADYGRGTDLQTRGVAVGKWTFVYDPPKGEFLIPVTGER